MKKENENLISKNISFYPHANSTFKVICFETQVHKKLETQQLKQQLQKNKMNIETIISGKQKVTENKKKLSEKQKK